MLYIEVKSMAQDTIGPFRMSINEWRLAKKCHEGSSQGVYVVVLVTSVTRMPRISKLIVNPIQHLLNGPATCEVSELIIDLNGGGGSST